MLRQRADHSHAAYLSVVAREFRRRVVLVDRVKNGIEYKNVFDGREAVVNACRLLLLFCFFKHWRIF